MIVILLLAAWGGRKLDEMMNNAKPYMTILLMIWGLGGFIYLLIKRLQNEQKQENHHQEGSKQNNAQ
jgi:preprotein translocase subunit YajC